ncbi:MAG: hypothetical protein LW688_13480 [Cryomorphaceae bacterium]|jgi:hypothetical protein|nr:hypothetical protein [Cryomorphaceae bacterium]
MIDFKKENDHFVLTLGFDFVTKAPKRIIPISKEEAIEIANKFDESFAEAIGENEMTWSMNELKLTDAPEHPFGWTDTRKRTMLHYNNLSWHMIAPEIAEIGRLAKRAIQNDV